MRSRYEVSTCTPIAKMGRGGHRRLLASRGYHSCRGGARCHGGRGGRRKGIRTRCGAKHGMTKEEWSTISRISLGARRGGGAPSCAEFVCGMQRTRGEGSSCKVSSRVGRIIRRSSRCRGSRRRRGDKSGGKFGRKTKCLLRGATKGVGQKRRRGPRGTTTSSHRRVTKTSG